MQRKEEIEDEMVRLRVCRVGVRLMRIRKPIATL